jgi:hypothetical protein
MKKYFLGAVIVVSLLGASCQVQPVTQNTPAPIPVTKNEPTAPAQLTFDSCFKIPPFPESPRQDCYKKLFAAAGTAACDVIQNQVTKDACLATLSKERNNVSICDGIRTPSYADQCYVGFSRCEKIIDNAYRDGCYGVLAEEKHDISLCNKITSHLEIKQECVGKLTTPSSSGRDAQRVADINAIQSALNRYYKVVGHYPIQIPEIEGTCLSDAGFAEQCSGAVYLNKVPSNPTPRTDGDCTNKNYNYMSGRTVSTVDDYALEFCVGGTIGSLTAGNHFVTPRGVDVL